MNFSLEIGPKTDIETVPPLSDVYITMLPGGDYKETADKAVELVKKGFNPIPHLANLQVPQGAVPNFRIKRAVTII